MLQCMLNNIAVLSLDDWVNVNRIPMQYVAKLLNNIVALFLKDWVNVEYQYNMLQCVFNNTAVLFLNNQVFNVCYTDMHAVLLYQNFSSVIPNEPNYSHYILIFNICSCTIHLLFKCLFLECQKNVYENSNTVLQSLLFFQGD